VYWHRSRHTVEMDTGKDWSEMSSLDTLTGTEQAEIRQYIRNRLSGVEIDVDKLPEWLAELERARVSRDAWKKLAELLGSNIVLKFDYDCFGDPIALRCPICHKKSGMADKGAEGDHKPDCPIEQLRKLKEGEG